MTLCQKSFIGDPHKFSLFNFHFSILSMFNFHTYSIDEEPCLLNVDMADLQPSYPEHVKLSLGLHPWKVSDDWQKDFEKVCSAAQRADVWAIGECGLDKVRGAALLLQQEAFEAHIALAQESRKPLVVHCVRAFDELLGLRKKWEQLCRQEGESLQPWIIHGFRGKPEQAQQIMAKGLLLSFGHHYHVETLRSVFAAFQKAFLEGVTGVNPFFLETDDLHLSVRQIYEQAAHHLDVDVDLLSRFCDPRQTIFSL